jgi:hypothetical protein
MMIESCREFCTAEYKLYRCRICSTEKAPGEWYLSDPSQSSEEFIEAAYDDIPRNEALVGVYKVKIKRRGKRCTNR